MFVSKRLLLKDGQHECCDICYAIRERFRQVDSLSQAAGKWATVEAGRGDGSVAVEIGVAPPATDAADDSFEAPSG
eukprot:scaffold253466_cov18-Prasinocladus_malaysianus.AAC.1